MGFFGGQGLLARRNGALQLALCLSLAQPPASWSVNFPSPRFVRRTFFRRCGCLLGPGAGIGIFGVGAGRWPQGTSVGGTDKTKTWALDDRLRSTSGPNKKKVQLAAGGCPLFTVFTAGKPYRMGKW